MENIHRFIGIFAGFLALIGYIPYIISILRGVTKPNRATWLIWTIVGGLLAFSFIATGDLHASWVPLGYFLGPFITMLLSIRYGYARWTRIDSFCLIAAVISLIPWMFLNNPDLTLLINVLIDGTGAIPTLIKTYHEPETEDLLAWFIFFLANTLELFAIETWNIASIYPIYLFILASLMVLFISQNKLNWLLNKFR